MIAPYQTARAFRAALEERLKRRMRPAHGPHAPTPPGGVCDRLLARRFAQPAAPWMLKGGYTFELRLGGRERATKDLDLSIPDLHRLNASGPESLAPPVVIREHLQEFAAQTLATPLTSASAYLHGRSGCVALRWSTLSRRCVPGCARLRDIPLSCRDWRRRSCGARTVHWL